jgi:hypothetical protein
MKARVAMSSLTIPTVAVKIRDLKAKNWGEKSGVDRAWGIWIEKLEVPIGIRVLVIGPRGGGKGALIDCIDRREQGVGVSDQLNLRRVNNPEELSSGSNGKRWLVLSEGHKMSKQERILTMCPEGSTVLASVDHDQIIGPTVLNPFSHVILMVDGKLSFFGTKHEFLHKLPLLLRKDKGLAQDFPEIKNLRVA